MSSPSPTYSFFCKSNIHEHLHLMVSLLQIKVVEVVQGRVFMVLVPTRRISSCRRDSNQIQNKAINLQVPLDRERKITFGTRESEKVEGIRRKRKVGKIKENNHINLNYLKNDVMSFKHYTQSTLEFGSRNLNHSTLSVHVSNCFILRT